MNNTCPFCRAAGLSVLLSRVVWLCPGLGWLSGSGIDENNVFEIEVGLIWQLSWTLTQKEHLQDSHIKKTTTSKVMNIN